MLKRPWRLSCVYEPEGVTSKIRVQLIPDLQNSDEQEGTVVDAQGQTGQGRVFDMAFTRGRLIQPVGREVYNYEQMVVTNFAPESPVRLMNLALMIEPRTSK